ncbi:MAG: 4Fe-4S dicluster domain-containing protein [Clostridiales Family XIII bacterium]|jgi:formate hydrogenlyase subunit 6/NADH:ubiquinone oxidoreductase subunit I|nr:4Fe-4S dicluster domain-containing protein [Clostridiales Family XIII bacterium]
MRRRFFNAPMIKTALRSLFKAPATVKFPTAPMEYGEIYRGIIENDIEACIFCGMCVKKCPAGVIDVIRDEKTWSIDRSGCIQCANCVTNCPKKCLKMVNVAPAAMTEQSVESLVNA